MRTGISEYRRNQFDAARAAFEAAWKLRHHSAIAASLADVEMKVGRYREAAEHWEYYLASSPPDRSEAEAQLADCAKRLGRLGVSVEPESADVFIDGEPVERASPTAPIWLIPGEHVISAYSEDRSSCEQRISIGAGERKTLTLAITADPGTAASSATPAPAPPPATQRDDAAFASKDIARPNHGARTWTVIGGAVGTAVALGIGVGYTISANGLEDDAARLRLATEQKGDPDLVQQKAQCASNAPTPVPSECVALRNTMNQIDTNRNIAIGAYVAAGVLGAATVATYILWPRDRSERAANVRWVVSPATDGATLRVLGDF